MPPRIPIAQYLRAQSTTLPSRTPPSSTFTRPFSAAPCPAAPSTSRRKYRDPYAIAQAKARKAANLSRQEVLQKERAAALGDPVRGETTSFLQSFDTAVALEAATSGSKTDDNENLNFYLTKDELARGLGRSTWLSNPLPSSEALADQEVTPAEQPQERGSDLFENVRRIVGSDPAPDQKHDWITSKAMFDDYTTDATPEQRQKRIEEENQTAEEALRRISSLDLGSSKDRLRVNKHRCISVFGRHNTDLTLPPKPRSTATPGSEVQNAPRAGPDTGSSEVQIAILSAKIRTLADFLDTRGTMDKVNKRNLRLLVHKRAKLLKYLRKQERGGPRWQNLVDQLGLTEGTWKGEITL